MYYPDIKQDNTKLNNLFTYLLITIWIHPLQSTNCADRESCEK